MGLASEHDKLRDRIAQEYFELPPLSCLFCHSTTSLPTANVARVVTEGSHRHFRADVAALDPLGRFVAVVEVVNTNPPSKQVLAAQSELEAAFYVTMDALDDGFIGYCSPICWSFRDEENSCPWRAPSCPRCHRDLHTLDFAQSLIDWEQPDEPVCLECAARSSDGQWRSPGEFALGDPAERIPGADADVIELFLAFSDAEFWSTVWVERSRDVQEAWTAEEKTRARLDLVEASFDAERWNEGQTLLQPIGAPAWDRPPGPPLLAYSHDNCVRTADAWRRLREYRLSCLPALVQEWIMSRKSDTDFGSGEPHTGLVHRGFPDGRFTACGIDRQIRDEAVEVTMTETPTCESCRTSRVPFGV